MSETTTVQKEPVLSGYYIKRPTHIELFIKSPLAKKCFENNGTLEWRFGKIYKLSGYMMDILTNSQLDSLNHNETKLYSFNDYPNLAILRSVNIDTGVKISLRGIYEEFEYYDFKNQFIYRAKQVLKAISDYKKKPYKIKPDKTEIEKIRNRERRDGSGWMHMNYGLCSCKFNSRLMPIYVCDECGNTGVLAYDG